MRVLKIARERSKIIESENISEGSSPRFLKECDFAFIRVDNISRVHLKEHYESEDFRSRKYSITWSVYIIADGVEYDIMTTYHKFVAYMVTLALTAMLYTSSTDKRVVDFNVDIERVIADEVENMTAMRKLTGLEYKSGMSQDEKKKFAKDMKVFNTKYAVKLEKHFGEFFNLDTDFISSLDLLEKADGSLSDA